jgi:hypothetical protein
MASIKPAHVSRLALVLALGSFSAACAHSQAHGQFRKIASKPNNQAVLISRSPFDPTQCVAFPDPPHVSETQKNHINWALTGEPDKSTLDIKFATPDKPFKFKCGNDDICRSGPVQKGAGPKNAGDPAVPYQYTCTITSSNPTTPVAKSDPTVMVDF